MVAVRSAGPAKSEPVARTLQRESSKRKFLPLNGLGEESSFILFMFLGLLVMITSRHSHDLRRVPKTIDSCQSYRQVFDCLHDVKTLIELKENPCVGWLVQNWPEMRMDSSYRKVDMVYRRCASCA